MARDRLDTARRAPVLDRRRELAEFLRRRREVLRPADVGLPVTARRRTPGLRRDEVAHLASISTDYYERLEQARGPHPSTAVLAGLARALRLTTDERDYLYSIAGQAPPPGYGSDGYADPGLMHVLDALAPTTPALITDELGVIVAQNPLNVALLGQYAGLPGRGANQLWRWFTDPEVQALYEPSQLPDLTRQYVADFRAAVARRGADPVAAALVAELSAASEEFRARWAEHEVAVRRTTRKVLLHRVGRLDLQCDVVISPPTGQRMVLFRPSPGTDTADRLALLGVVGTERF